MTGGDLMGKANLVNELTSKCVDNHLIVSYHPKADIYIDMVFDCVKSEVGYRRLQCLIMALINEETKTLTYFQKFEERSMGYSTYHKPDEQRDRIKEEVYIEDVSGKKKTMMFDSEEVAYLFLSTAENHGYKFRRVNDRKQLIPVELSERQKRQLDKEENRNFPLWQWGLIFVVLAAFNLYFSMELFGWILSVATAMIMLIATRIFESYLPYFLSLWLVIQLALWFFY